MPIASDPEPDTRTPYQRARHEAQDRIAATYPPGILRRLRSSPHTRGLEEQAEAARQYEARLTAGHEASALQAAHAPATEPSPELLALQGIAARLDALGDVRGDLDALKAHLTAVDVLPASPQPVESPPSSPPDEPIQAPAARRRTKGSP